MRIRRKKHLGERLGAVKDYLIIPERDVVNVLEAVKMQDYFDFKAIFSNENPVEMEIGCGKGSFIVQKAKQNPNVNYIAVELLENIIVMAAEQAKKENLSNVKFVNSGAEYLPRYIKPDSISNIYLNFSPPFGKDGYESRRLTSGGFVDSYLKYLMAGGKIYQKTDDKDFFDYSFNKFKEKGFAVEDVSGLIKNKEIDNIETEYEKKFLSLNMEVYGLIATKTK